MAVSVEGLIYAEAQRGLALQPVLLNELRARTGILLALIAASTSFLGGLTVDSDKFGCWGIAALIAFVLAVASCLIVLSPRREWTFAESAADLLMTHCDTPRSDGSQWTLAGVEREVALHMEDHMRQAIRQMKTMQAWYLVGGLLVAVETALWLIEFAN